jgi:hypothetical protein
MVQPPRGRLKKFCCVWGEKEMRGIVHIKDYANGSNIILSLTFLYRSQHHIMKFNSLAEIAAVCRWLEGGRTLKVLRIDLAYQTLRLLEDRPLAESIGMLMGQLYADNQEYSSAYEEYLRTTKNIATLPFNTSIRYKEAAHWIMSVDYVHELYLHLWEESKQFLNEIHPGFGDIIGNLILISNRTTGKINNTHLKKKSKVLNIETTKRHKEAVYCPLTYIYIHLE